MTLRYPWKLVAGLVATLLLPVAVVSGSVLAVRAATGLPSDAALRVAGVTVSKTELRQRIRVLGALYGLRAPADPGMTDQFNRAAARAVALRIVIDKAIAERRLAVSPERSAQLLADFVARGVNPPGQAGFLALLRDAGASEGDVVAELDRREGTRELLGQVTAPVAAPLTDAELHAYYRDHQAELVWPERRHLRNIVVATQEQAAALHTDLGRGADFAALARQSSLDRRTRDAGGDLGSLRADQLDEAYRGPAFAAAPGAVFGPVQTSEGWNLGQVLEVSPPAPVGFDEARGRLGEWLRQRRVEQAWQEWQDRQLAGADASYADEYRPNAAGPAGSAGLPQ